MDSASPYELFLRGATASAPPLDEAYDEPPSPPPPACSSCARPLCGGPVVAMVCGHRLHWDCVALGEHGSAPICPLHAGAPAAGTRRPLAARHRLYGLLAERQLVAKASVSRWARLVGGDATRAEQEAQDAAVGDDVVARIGPTWCRIYGVTVGELLACGITADELHHALGFADWEHMVACGIEARDFVRYARQLPLRTLTARMGLARSDLARLAGDDPAELRAMAAGYGAEMVAFLGL